ncbi:MAG: MASE1 domain-containing protein [Gammaproteobacteria bacterium]|nr:MASE1 domain-containing protein [Gammaproteobacteria bacterium]
MMKRAGDPRQLTVLIGLAAVYFVAGKFGLQLAFLNASATPVWPATGISLTAFLILGQRAWIGIFLGAFLVNITNVGTVATSLGIALGNTLEGAVGAWLVLRFAGGRSAFENPRNIFRFVLLAAVLSTAVSATLGVTSLALAGFADWRAYWAVWLTWWLGDAMGAIVVTPLLLLCFTDSQPDWRPAQVVEAGTLLAGLGLVGAIVFGGFASAELQTFPLEILCTPVLLWAAFRFGPRETAAGIAVLSGIAIWGTVNGFGPFVIDDRNTSLLMLQAFMGVTSVMTLALAAEVFQRRRAEERANSLAITDPLTGLANYRRLFEALEFEMGRSRRSGRSFAIMLLDVDGLKTLNDRYGHLAGNQALVRLANVLRANCRATDIAGRFGGDEFMLILPEETSEAAQNLLQRISEDMENDRQEPRVSVSAGAAMYPQEGENFDQLIAAADRAMYKVKRDRK